VAENRSAGALQPSCRDAEEGDECFGHVIWAMKHGIVDSPGDFEGLNTFSSFQEFQAHLHRRKPSKSQCEQPCRPLSWDEMLVPTLEQAVAEDPDLEAAKEADLCSAAMEVPSAVADMPRWNVTDDENDGCFSLYTGLTNKHGWHKSGRNWCWVSFKEFGCHRTFYGEFTWREDQQTAMRYIGNLAQSYHPLRNADMCDQRHLGTSPSWSASQWAEAQRWFRRNAAVYVLSLPTSTARRQMVTKRFKELKLPFDFVDGVDLRESGGFEQAVKEDLIPAEFDLARAQAEALRARNDMSGQGSILGTVGCAAGHFRVQKHAARKEGSRPLTVVFEDDVSPSSDFVPRLWSLVTQELPCDWQAVSLASRCPFGECVSPHLTRVRPDVNEPEWRCHHGVNYGFQGMLYRTSEIDNLQEKWKPLVFNGTRPHCLDVDVALAAVSDQVRFYAVPQVQVPGFLKMVVEVGSSRLKINFAASKTPR